MKKKWEVQQLQQNICNWWKKIWYFSFKSSNYQMWSKQNQTCGLSDFRYIREVRGKKHKSSCT